MSALPDQLPSPRSPKAIGKRENRVNTLNPLLTGPIPKPLLSVGGGLGFAGVLLGLSLFIFDCAGFDAALFFSPAVLALGSAGGILAFLSTRQSPPIEDGPVMASLFIAILAILGGSLELAILLQWPILFNQHS